MCAEVGNAAFLQHPVPLNDGTVGTGKAGVTELEQCVRDGNWGGADRVVRSEHGARILCQHGPSIATALLFAERKASSLPTMTGSAGEPMLTRAESRRPRAFCLAAAQRTRSAAQNPLAPAAATARAWTDMASLAGGQWGVWLDPEICELVVARIFSAPTAASVTINNGTLAPSGPPSEVPSGTSGVPGGTSGVPGGPTGVPGGTTGVLGRPSTGVAAKSSAVAWPAEMLLPSLRSHRLGADGFRVLAQRAGLFAPPRQVMSLLSGIDLGARAKLGRRQIAEQAAAAADKPLGLDGNLHVETGWDESGVEGGVDAEACRLACAAVAGWAWASRLRHLCRFDAFDLRKLARYGTLDQARWRVDLASAHCGDGATFGLIDPFGTCSPVERQRLWQLLPYLHCRWNIALFDCFTETGRTLVEQEIRRHAIVRDAERRAITTAIAGATTTTDIRTGPFRFPAELLAIVADMLVSRLETLLDCPKDFAETALRIARSATAAASATAYASGTVTASTAAPAHASAVRGFCANPPELERVAEASGRSIGSVRRNGCRSRKRPRSPDLRASAAAARCDNKHGAEWRAAVRPPPELDAPSR